MLYSCGILSAKRENAMKHTIRVVRAASPAAGFTMVEILIVVVILAIAAMVAIPTLGSAADMQVRAAANKIAADLDYAKGLAITRQRNFTVVFDPDGKSYKIQDEAGAVITHPVLGGNFQVDLRNERNLGRVDIASANFDNNADNAVTFNYLGSPFAGTDTGSPLNSGQVSIQAGTFGLTVNVEPMTGYVTISDP